jgi:hypothetical protein
MGRNSKAIVVNMKRLHWDDVIWTNGGGIGEGNLPTAAPYLWTVLFKADGSTLSVTDKGGTAPPAVVGEPTIIVTPGSHGNLDISSLQVGSGVDIPSELGWWTTTLQPIPIEASLQSELKTADFPGFFGAVAVLMVQRQITEQAAEAGHSALNSFVRNAIQSVVSSLGLGHPMVTADDIASVTAGAEAAVAAQVRSAQTFWQNLESWIDGPDSSPGHFTWLWNQDMFPDASDDKQMNNTVWTDALGLWGIDGDVLVIDQCPSDVSPATAIWQKQAGAHVVELGALLQRQPTVAGPAQVLIAKTDAMLAKHQDTLSKDFLSSLGDVLSALAKVGSPNLARGARRVLPQLPSLEGKSLREVSALINAAIGDTVGA